MFCTKCGKEIPEGSNFCSGCGNKVSARSPKLNPDIAAAGTDRNPVPAEFVKTAENVQNAGTQQGKGKSVNKLYIAAAVVVLLLLIAVLAVFLKIAAQNEEKEASASIEAAETVEKEEEAEEMVPEQETAPEEPELMPVPEGMKLMVCVPVDYMSLRQQPGLGDDVITQLGPGTQLISDGIPTEVNEQMFYKVIVRETGQEGYAAANYCVEVDLDVPSDMEVLPIVETDTALYTYDMMAEDIVTLAKQYAHCVSYNIMGMSLDGRQMYEVILGNPNAPNHILAQGGIHGREYMTPQLLMKMVEYYAYYYESGTYHGISYKELLDQTAIHIVPMMNPDGVTISQLGVGALNNDFYKERIYECYERDKEFLVYELDSNGDPNWVDYYKDENFDRSQMPNQQIISFEEYQTIWKANAEGVDLNNNFDADWGNIDLKGMPSYGSFKGHYAVSEPETEALVNLALQREYKYFLSYHSRGQLIYYDVNGNTPETSALSLGLAELLQSKILYKPVNTQKAYNVNLGGFGDWVQLSLQQASVTIENGKKPCPLAIEEFPGMWNRHRESWAMLMETLYQ